MLCCIPPLFTPCLMCIDVNLMNTVFMLITVALTSAIVIPVLAVATVVLAIPLGWMLCMMACMQCCLGTLVYRRYKEDKEKA